ncbi:DNA gyrase subunit A [Oceanospirillum multiglobuliferum]|uniref:DNA gyrase subunit A n=1 Tax=Oceanospirillum multiglobuliferum TaxID=64969 RepID=A0A1T4KP91_9GAMM|nr:DNA gyrase subunit A [Oceanospirillum multiglobuliferum]OPX56093.1 DNA gyrase subunit A [Oceanospirillum multiglobuliferum]SJZ44229.1 DNA gyrase subunit A [Oceanospirillum multiglobuliferum]
MGEFAKEILPVNIEDELKQSYLDYAMSVIVGRALPDVRDGLKPVHRRVLFAMHELGNDWNKAYKKSARVVGDVIGKYHPHGDSAVYDTIVRMAQPFSMRHMLVDGQGNFGSIDGDNAAAMRYTEVRMARISHEMLADLDKETVDFVDNYDGSERIPEVLPTRVPNLLVNGSSGIAVGMATNIPPHNLAEVINGCLALLDDPDLSVDDLMEFIPGPDFPTAAIINGRAGILQAYRTGRGRIYVRARHTIERDDKTNRETIIIHEIPYQLNKARVIERIAELVKEKKIEGISELRDESDKDGLRVVIELKRGESGEVVVNNLFAQTQLQNVFGINIVALENGQPKVMNLKQLIEAFLRHRREVVTRRTVYELRKARERGHLLEGLAIALANIDPVIELIRTSPSAAEAKEKLLANPWTPGNVIAMLERAGADSCRPDELEAEFGLRDDSYYLSPAQAQAILELRLHRLTGLEHEKLLNEYQEILGKIAELGSILADSEKLLQVIREEMVAIRDQYGEPRRTEIISSQLDLTMEDLITEEDMVVTISRTGYAKAQPLSDYRAQRRGGRGKSATAVKDEDVVEHLLVTSTHDTVLLFSNKGKVYWLKVYELPQAGRGSRGRPMVNLLPLDEGEQISAILPVREYQEDHYVFMATAKGTVKKTALSQFSRPRSSGLIALDIEEGDRLIGAAITNGTQHVMLLSSAGKMIRFDENDVRAMGRTARGVRGMRLPEGAQVISLIIPQTNVIASEDEEQVVEAVDAIDGESAVLEDQEIYILTASENGYGKRTRLEAFPVYGRGGQGVIAMQTSERNGQLVAAIQVSSADEMMLITDQGTLVRTRVSEVSISGRNTQGVTLIRLSDEERLVTVVQVNEPEGVDDLSDEAQNDASVETEVQAPEQPTDSQTPASDEA